MSSFDVNMFKVSEEVKSIFNSAPKVIVPKSRQHLLDLSTGGGQSVFKVNYPVDGVGLVEEAVVTKCKNGVSVNYLENYMRRRDPECMLIGDNRDTDKTKYKERFNEDFDGVRQETYEWLKKTRINCYAIDCRR